MTSYQKPEPVAPLLIGMAIVITLAFLATWATDTKGAKA